MTSCSQAEIVVAWAKRGSEAALDPTVERHLETCPECHELFREIVLVRGIAKELPVHELASERRDALRFAVMAEARRGRRRSSWPAGLASRPVRRRLAWAAAACALIVGGVGGFLSGRTMLAPPQSVASVALLPGAEGATELGPPDEIYRLVRGKADFAVEKLGKERRYRVLAGDGTVEVRGTRFRLDVAEGRLRAVDVSEGEVWVWLGGSLVADLQKGEHWTRTPAAPPSSVAGSTAGSVSSTPEATERNVTSVPTERNLVPVVPRAEASSPAPKSVASLDAPKAVPAASSPGAESPDDSAFARAWELYKRGESLRAAAEFDSLVSTKLDAARRADVLYWAAQAYARAGRPATAEARARRLASEFSGSFRAADAALMLGEITLARGDRVEAREWFRRAATSSHPSVRAKAEKSLAELGPAR